MLSVLMIGDIVGKPGRKSLADKLPKLLQRYAPDLVIANGENAAGGKGINEPIAKEIFDLGVDIITMGNHVWDNRDILRFIDETPRLIRPANFPEGAPGRGWVIHELRPGIRPFAVVNLLGRAFMNPVDCPFQAAARLYDEILKNSPSDKAPVLIVDFHAESTSEKETMGYFLAGKAAAVLGSHTHVQTADERVLSGGTAYITDLGMTGTRESVLGVKPEIMIRRFVHQLPVRHELEEGPGILSGVWIQIDEESGKATGITRFAEQ